MSPHEGQKLSRSLCEDMMGADIGTVGRLRRGLEGAGACLLGVARELEIPSGLGGGLEKKLQYNTIQYTIIQYNKIQYNTI